jgi:hypothetical protein
MIAHYGRADQDEDGGITVISSPLFPKRIYPQLTTPAHDRGIFSIIGTTVFDPVAAG